MSETRTMTVAEFLLARYDEDEADARRFAGSEIGYFDLGSDSKGADATEFVRESMYPSAHVLADCAAKHRIVMLHAPAERDCPACISHYDASGRAVLAVSPCPTLRALASAYADHPDFRDEWR